MMYRQVVLVMILMSHCGGNWVQHGNNKYWETAQHRNHRQYLTRSFQPRYDTHRGQTDSQSGQGHISQGHQDREDQTNHDHRSHGHQDREESNRDHRSHVHHGQTSQGYESRSHGSKGQGYDSQGHHESKGQTSQDQHSVNHNQGNIHKGQGDHQQNQGHFDKGQGQGRPYHYSRQPTQGQSAPHCMYNFIVNELDSSKCPVLLQQLQQQQNQQQQKPQSNIQNDQDILTRYYENLNMNKDFDNLVKRIDALENRLLREIAKNRELENDFLELENVQKRTDIMVAYHEQNISNVATVVKHGEIMQQKQMGYWKNVDEKLSGIILDVVELNNRLDRQDSIMHVNDEASKKISVESTGMKSCSGIQNATKFKDCEDLFHHGHKRSGVYYITPIYTTCSIPVYCDMDTPPGGWLVIQRRMHGDVSFNRSWTEYRHGFGHVGGEHWLGNDNLFLLTNQLHYALRVDLYDFYNSRVYAEYKYFKIDGERDRYMLHVGNHSGTAPDGLGNHNNVRFSTPDQDHDEWLDYHCAKEWAAGWWFNNCWFVILNGPYYNTTDVKYRGISWNDWKSEQLKHVEMKIRPAGF